MTRQGIIGARLSPARKLAAFTATALVALAVPAAASATTSVTAEDAGFDLIVYVDGDGGDSSLAVSVTSEDVIVTGADLDPSGDDSAGNYCTGSSTTVACDWSFDDDATLDAHLGGGNDALDISAAGYSGLYYPTLRGEGGNDTLTGAGGNDRLIGGPGSDLLLGGQGDDELDLNDGEADAPGSDCGGGDDYLDNDALDPLVSGCEDVSYIPPSSGGGNGSTPRPTKPARVTKVPSNVFVTGAFAGSTLSITTPGPGVLSSGPATTASTSKTKKKKAKVLVSTTSITARSAGTFKLPVKLTSAGKKVLKKKKLKTKVTVIFAPTGGTPSSKTVSVTFKKKKKKK